MPGASTRPPDSGQCFEADRLDMSELVGRAVVLFAEQFPGRMLRSRVLSTANRELEIDSGAKFDLIENLVTNQQIVLQFSYRGEEISVKAQLRRSAGGRCFLRLYDDVTPLSQRRFVRKPISVKVKLAAYPSVTFRPTDLSRLRWISTDSVNISSGGTMVVVPSMLQKDVLLMMNVDMQGLPFPKLILAKVRHCFQTDSQYYHAGVEYIISDEARRMFSQGKRQQLPASLFSYSREQRERLNREILELDTEDNGLTDRSES
ncbi:hypothetical protein GF377_04230 [candidate division GN15 bacterium]|nr:hypothetical protein [candidate division GN15 bacterium]